MAIGLVVLCVREVWGGSVACPLSQDALSVPTLNPRVNILLNQSTPRVTTNYNVRERVARYGFIFKTYVFSYQWFFLLWPTKILLCKLYAEYVKRVQPTILMYVALNVFDAIIPNNLGSYSIDNVFIEQSFALRHNVSFNPNQTNNFNQTTMKIYEFAETFLSTK